MSLKQLTKNGLLDLTEKLGLSSEGTKPILEERIAQYFDNHPELEGDEEYKKYIQFRKRNSPKKTSQILDEVSTPSATRIKPLNEKLNSSPNKFLSINRRFRGNTSLSKANEEESEDDDSEDDDSEDDDEDDEEDEEEDDNVIEVTKNDSELLEEDDDEDSEKDADFKESKFEFITKVQDWLINKYEETNDFIIETYEDSTDALLKQNAGLRKSLSSADSVNLLTAVSEVTIFLYQQVPTIPLRQAPFLDQEILSKYTNYINLQWTVFDLSVFFELKFLFTLFTWTALSLVLPAIGSYYFNFIHKKSRKIKYDPLVFNLFKLLLAYFFLSGNVSFNDVKSNAEIWAQEHGLLENTSLLTQLRAHLFHSSITLRLVLGNLPFINASVGILVALYVAAI